MPSPRYSFQKPFSKPLKVKLHQSSIIVISFMAITMLTTLLVARAASSFSPTHYISQTFHQPDGNRLANGFADLSKLSVVDIPLSERPS